MTDKTVKELLVKLEAMQPEEPVLFSGSTTMEKDMFSALYEPLLDKVIEKHGKVRVGCANGCDTLVQQHCIEANYLNVHVFVPSEAATANVVCLSDSFEKTVVEGGFKKRDRTMQVGCKHSVGFYSQYVRAELRRTKFLLQQRMECLETLARNWTATQLWIFFASMRVCLTILDKCNWQKQNSTRKNKLYKTLFR